MDNFLRILIYKLNTINGDKNSAVELKETLKDKQVYLHEKTLQYN